MRRTVVKVCGITRLEDARNALAAGADWLGFVLAGESPRRVAAEVAAEIVGAVAPAIAVGVLVAPRPDQALALARRAGVARLQLHRVEPAAWPEDFPLALSFALPVGADGRLAGALPAARHLVLLDTAHPALAGGTGLSFPWEAAAGLCAERAVMIAGGLDAANVAAAIERARPFGVDASSRLETAPGIKDPDKVRRFVAAVRECDERLSDVA